MCDAREIMPHHQLVLHHASGSPAPGSDRFRYLIMKKGLGVWLDTDVILIKAIPKHDYVFGWQDVSLINNAILYLPPSSPLTGDLCEFVNQRYPIPPFYDDAVRSGLELRLKNGVPVDVGDLPWGVYGPEALTYFIRKNDLLHWSKSPDVFYPVPWRDAHVLVSSKYDVYGAITALTVAVHLWNFALRAPSIIRPKNPRGKLIIEKGCFVEKFAREQLGYRLESSVLADASATHDLYSAVPRNAVCPCGSGKQFKHCHGKYA